MDVNTYSTPTSSPQQGYTPVVENIPPNPTIQQPVMATGGATGAPATNGSSTFGFLKDVNWMEFGLLFVGTLALYYTIHFYRYKLAEERTAYYDTQKSIDGAKQTMYELQAKVQALSDFVQSGQQTVN